VTAGGKILAAPDDWELLPPGDAALTRRVKAGGPSWTVYEKRGRRKFSRGVWASAQRIAAIREELTAERATDSYQKRKKADSKRRARQQDEYVEEFRAAVVAFLDFAASHGDLVEQLADAVTRHATPVGSGTVARTKRISIDQRAAASVIAWMRHQTTSYDQMRIARVRGERRDVRRQLAEQSDRLLAAYRRGDPVDSETCPLQQALRGGGYTDAAAS
jgi:hypothetical protein